MTRAELVQALRTDLGDPDAAVFSDPEIGRFIDRAVLRLGRDLSIDLAVVGGEITPEPEGEVADLLGLLGQIYACEQMRARTAGSFSFQSGDKRVDKSREAEHWSDLEKDLWSQYRQRLEQVATGSDPTSDVLGTGGLRPVIYEQGGDL